GDGVGAVLESAQREEVLAEGLPQLVLPRDPERLVLLHGVQRPFGGAVEAEYHAAAAARPGLDDHRGEHERLVPQLSVVDDEQVAVGRRPGEPGLTETACDVDVDHVPNLRPMAPERTGWGLERPPDAARSRAQRARWCCVGVCTSRRGQVPAGKPVGATSRLGGRASTHAGSVRTGVTGTSRARTLERLPENWRPHP